MSTLDITNLMKDGFLFIPILFVFIFIAAMVRRLGHLSAEPLMNYIQQYLPKRKSKGDTSIKEEYSNNENPSLMDYIKLCGKFLVVLLLFALISRLIQESSSLRNIFVLSWLFHSLGILFIAYCLFNLVEMFFFGRKVQNFPLLFFLLIFTVGANLIWESRTLSKVLEELESSAGGGSEISFVKNTLH